MSRRRQLDHIKLLYNSYYGYSWQIYFYDQRLLTLLQKVTKAYDKVTDHTVLTGIVT